MPYSASRKQKRYRGTKFDRNNLIVIELSCVNSQDWTRPRRARTFTRQSSRASISFATCGETLTGSTPTTSRQSPGTRGSRRRRSENRRTAGRKRIWPVTRLSLPQAASLQTVHEEQVLQQQQQEEGGDRRRRHHRHHHNRRRGHHQEQQQQQGNGVRETNK